MCPKRKAACCSWKVRRENSVERTMQLLLCCLCILRGSEGVATKAAESNFNSHSLLGRLRVLYEHSCNMGLTLIQKYTDFNMPRHAPLPRGRFTIDMPAVWVPIWNLSSPPCCFPVLTLSLQRRHILFQSPTWQGFEYSVSVLCSVKCS